MKVTIVTAVVKPGRIEDFIRETTINHKSSVKEPGNLRFDFLQSSQDPTRFVLYEAYESDEAALAHKKTEHYLAWRNVVADMMAKSRHGDPFKVIEPENKSEW